MRFTARSAARGHRMLRQFREAELELARAHDAGERLDETFEDLEASFDEAIDQAIDEERERLDYGDR